MTKRINAYDAYKYLKEKSPGSVKGYIQFMKKKHPIIYKKELEPHLR